MGLGVFALRLPRRLTILRRASWGLQKPTMVLPSGSKIGSETVETLSTISALHLKLYNKLSAKKVEMVTEMM